MILLQILRFSRHAEVFDVGWRGECFEPEFAHFSGNQRLIAQHADPECAVDILRDVIDQTVADTEIETDMRITLVKFAKMWDNHQVREDTGHFHPQPAGWLHLCAGHAAVKFFDFR
ncbi:hypothetical protein D3C86_1214340 [compost metagenome]